MAASTFQFSAKEVLLENMMAPVTTTAPPSAKIMTIFWMRAKILTPKTMVRNASTLVTVATTKTPQS